MTGPRREVAGALGALEVVLPAGYRWMGEPFEVPEAVARLAPPGTVREALVQAVSWRLYADFYTSGGPRPASRGGGPREPRALSHLLRAANAGTGSVDHGWTCIGRDGPDVIVARKGLWLWARPGEVVAGDPRGPLPGRPVAVRLPPDAPEMSPGFYLAMGDRGFSAEIPRRLDRFYFDLRLEGAVPFVRLATRALNRAGLAFRAKVSDEPEGFDRRDSALLGFERRDRARSLPAALALREALGDLVGAGRPALTRPLAPGLGFSEEPSTGESFGIHRCRAIAEAAVSAEERGVRDPAGRLRIAAEAFEAAGTLLEAPHIGRDSEDLRLEPAGAAGEEVGACR